MYVQSSDTDSSDLFDCVSCSVEQKNVKQKTKTDNFKICQLKTELNLSLFFGVELELSGAVL